MAVRRNKETGETIEDADKTVGRGKKPLPDRPEEVPTLAIGRHRAHRPSATAVPTGGAEQEPPPSPGAGESRLDVQTRVWRARQQESNENPPTPPTRPIPSSSHGADAAQARPRSEDPMSDPVVGWLVVVAGPGKGRVCQLGYGTNSLGRGESSRVRLDFGDEGISREEHASVTYDPRGRKFYLLHGGGKNLTYLGDEPVLVPTVLGATQDFSIGETTLRLVPLCGPEFDWQDINAD